MVAHFASNIARLWKKGNDISVLKCVKKQTQTVAIHFFKPTICASRKYFILSIKDTYIYKINILGEYEEIYD